MGRYNPKEAEPHWRERWAADNSFRTLSAEEAGARPKYYVLEMFPYPSGRIHMGHVRNYTMGDVVARFKRAQGFNVLHPMGWDAFGMPAENAAMERGVHPKGWTYDNIAAMREPLKTLGLSIDWSREFATCDPDYYGQEQKLFLDLYRRGLAYRREGVVNWDPVDMTVLANEQVIDGRGWRSGAVVEKRKLTQWFLRITHYADDLIEGLKSLDRWPDKVRLMQENWIGRSQGLRLSFKVTGGAPAEFDTIDVYTTRPDTLFGASFIGVAPDHPLAQTLAADRPELTEFIAKCRQGGASEAYIEAGEKLGFLPGDLLEKVDPYLAPIWAALDEILGTEQARKRRERNEIEVAPLAYMRGRTLSRAYIIVDEAQNTTRMQMKMVLTRLGEGSTMVVTGDPSQIDLLSARDCGLNHAISILEGIEGIGVARLSVSDIVRHRLVGEIVQAYDREGAGS